MLAREVQSVSRELSGEACVRAAGGVWGQVRRAVGRGSGKRGKVHGHGHGAVAVGDMGMMRACWASPAGCLTD